MQAIILIEVVKVKYVLPSFVTLNCGPRKTLWEIALPYVFVQERELHNF